MPHAPRGFFWWKRFCIAHGVPSRPPSFLIFYPQRKKRKSVVGSCDLSCLLNSRRLSWMRTSTNSIAAPLPPSPPPSVVKFGVENRETITLLHCARERYPASASSVVRTRSPIFAFCPLTDYPSGKVGCWNNYSYRVVLQFVPENLLRFVWRPCVRLPGLESY